MVLPDKKAPTTKICRNTKKEMTFSPRTIANIFEKHLANFASDPVKKLLHPTGKLAILRQYYNGFNFREKDNLNLKKEVQS